MKPRYSMKLLHRPFETLQIFEAPFENKIIATAPIFHVSKQKKLFSAFLKNVKKAFQPKHRTDPAFKLFQKFHDFFELIFEKKNE